MDYNEIQRLLEKNRQDLGIMKAEGAGIYDKYAPSTDPEIARARAVQADKVKQLFSHDSQLAQRKWQPSAPPGPTVTGAPPELPPEELVDPMIGLKAANWQTMATANEAIDIGQNISKRKDFLKESLESALQLFQVGLEMKKAEREALSEEMDDWFNLQDLILKQSESKSKLAKNKPFDVNAFIQSLSGGGGAMGSASPPLYSPSDPNKIITQGGRKWKYDTTKGQWEDLSVGTKTKQDQEELAQMGILLGSLGDDPEAQKAVAQKIILDKLIPKETNVTEADKKRQIIKEIGILKGQGKTIEELKKFVEETGYSTIDPEIMNSIYL